MPSSLLVNNWFQNRVALLVVFLSLTTKLILRTFLDDETTIHGLDTLIEYYQEGNRGLETVLRNPCKGAPPPHDTRRHGRTNLLHRATIQV